MISFLYDHIYRYRNRIQHGIKVDVEDLMYIKDMLESIVRTGLQQYIQFLMLYYNNDQTNVDNSLDTLKTNPIVKFNKQLSL